MVNSILDDLKLKFRTGNSATKLIYINVITFFTFLILGFLLKKIDPYYSIDRFLALSKFADDYALKPWTFLSYAFLHGDLLHLLFNMLLLYYVGLMFLRYFRNQDFITFYSIGILSGAIFFVVFASFFSNSSTFLVGSSAAIFTVFFGLVSYNPKIPIRLIFIPTTFPILYIAYFFLALDVYQLIAGNNPGGSLSHLGGALIGYLYMKQFERGNDFVGNGIRKLQSFFNKEKKTTFKTYKQNTKTENKPQIGRAHV